MINLMLIKVVQSGNASETIFLALFSKHLDSDDFKCQGQWHFISHCHSGRENYFRTLVSETDNRWKTIKVEILKNSKTPCMSVVLEIFMLIRTVFRRQQRLSGWIKTTGWNIIRKFRWDGVVITLRKLSTGFYNRWFIDRLTIICTFSCFIFKSIHQWIKDRRQWTGDDSE